MSSILRTTAVKKEGLTLFLKPESPTYNNGVSNVLFPFSYSNGVLDISYSGNSFKSIMVDVVNMDPNSETETAVRITSGPYLVTSLGDHFKDYVRAWRDGTIDANSPISIHIMPQLLRVQEVSYADVSADSGDSWKISTEPPNSQYIVGDPSNLYQTTYIFKTPLTFTIVEGGVTKYVTFRSMLDQE
jgi:hypothetical protein